VRLVLEFGLPLLLDDRGLSDPGFTSRREALESPWDAGSHVRRQGLRSASPVPRRARFGR